MAVAGRYVPNQLPYQSLTADYDNEPPLLCTPRSRIDIVTRLGLVSASHTFDHNGKKTELAETVFHHEAEEGESACHVGQLTPHLTEPLRQDLRDVERTDFVPIISLNFLPSHVPYSATKRDAIAKQGHVTVCDYEGDGAFRARTISIIIASLRLGPTCAEIRIAGVKLV